MNKVIAIIAMVIGFQANAGVLVEPYIGYDQSTMKNTTVGGVSDGATNSGLDYGARFGYRFSQGFWAAAEYAAGSGKSKSDTAGATDSDYSKTALGAVFGYNTGRWNFWAGYGFSDTLTVKQSGSADVDITGTSLKVGAGFRATPNVSVNLEYMMPKYTKMKSSGMEFDIDTIYSKFDTSGTMLSVSFPFDITK